MVKYFAYGSNMNPDRMISRVYKVYDIEFATLENYRLTFNKMSHLPGFGYATIEPALNQNVPGIIYTINETGERLLDQYEGVPYHYTKELIQVEEHECMTYIAHPSMTMQNLMPTNSYLHHIKEGRRFISKKCM